MTENNLETPTIQTGNYKENVDGTRTWIVGGKVHAIKVSSLSRVAELAESLEHQDNPGMNP